MTYARALPFAAVLLVFACDRSSDPGAPEAGSGAASESSGADSGEETTGIGDDSDSGGDADGDGDGDGGGDTGQLPDPEDVRRIDMGANAASPVGALIDADRVAWAYVRVDDGSVHVGGDDVADTVFADDGIATSVALVAGPDGSLHAVWDPSGQIAYARRDPDGTWSDAQILNAYAGRDPTIALDPDGEPVVAYARDVDPYPPTQIVVQTLTGPESVVSDGCCGEGEFSEISFSGPSLSVAPDGSAHVLFEWGQEHSASIEYANDRSGVFEVRRIVDQALFFPCPAIVADEDGASITFLPSPNTEVRYLRDSLGALSDTEVVLEAEEIRLALLVPRGDGLHLVANVSGAEEGGSVVVGKLDSPERISALDAADAQLTPFAGGTFAHEDSFGFAVLRADNRAELHVFY